MGINAVLDKNEMKELNSHLVNIIPLLSGCLEHSVAVAEKFIGRRTRHGASEATA